MIGPEVPMDFIDSTFAILVTGQNNSYLLVHLQILLQKVLFLGLEVLLFLFHRLPFYFLFISILEESGYMSRVVFLMDRIMRRFGLKWKKCCAINIWYCLCHSSHYGHTEILKVGKNDLLPFW